MNNSNTILIGQSPEFQALLRSIQVTAVTDVTIMLLGDSGTGKELLARELHRQSSRKDAPFVAINCAALPESLAESELFGHRKGAFTGAVENSIGRIRSADGGSLFLDEVAELPLKIQGKLLRFLESGECQPVGDTAHHHSDVRLIAATHVDLFERVKQGLFREDLYYRINVVPLEIPALKKRSGDIPLLLKSLTENLSAQHGLDAPRYSKACMQLLEGYEWPGNVRELRNFCERMLVLFAGKEINPENLPHEICRTPASSGGPFILPDAGIQWDEMEQDMIHQALNKAHGNQSKAARLLGLTRDTFLYRIKKYAIT
jgi:DNA-binding NtrC family response regulator